MTMVKPHFRPGWSWRASLILTILAGVHGLPTAAQIPIGGHFSLFHHKAPRKAPVEDPNAVHPSQPPAFTIPVGQLGFADPSTFYEGQRESLVSLDFLDEDRLLFTFRAPGLLRRDAADGDERQIHAVVLALPQGRVQAEALWTLHDASRYLWMLNDGHFLLRDRDNLEQGDASLELKPLLHFPGPLLWLEMDPTEQFMVTDSKEPVSLTPGPDDVPVPATAAAGISMDRQDSESQPAAVDQPDIVLRILRRSSGKVMLVSRVRLKMHIPIDTDGYLEVLPGSDREWVLNLNYFSGGSRILGKLESICAPALEFIAPEEALAATCTPEGGQQLVAMSTDGLHLWDLRSPPTQVWPLLVMASDGLRLARETLTVTHPVDAFSPLSFDDVKGQLVEVYDAANGKTVLTAPASPILDGGGNVAISPSARRVAVLDAGAIKVYALPPPAVLAPPETKASKP